MPSDGKEELPVAQIENWAEMLREKAGFLDGMAALMKKRRIKEVKVMNHRGVERGLDSLNRMILAIKRELGEL